MKTMKWGLGTAGAMVLAGAMALSAQTAGKGFTPVNLVSDIAGVARHTDSALVNPWGLAIGPGGRIWVANAGTGAATVYSKVNGTPLPLIVTIPSAAGGTEGTPTGLIYNPTTNFVVSGGGTSAPALFIFATEDGTISGWNPDVDASNAVVMLDNSSGGAVYKGLALGQSGGTSYLYAANFSAGVVEMYDADLALVQTFTDPDPDIQTNGFAPFGVQVIGNRLYVTFAQKDPNSDEDVPGLGNGYVDVFGTDGVLRRRLASQGTLNSPWGVALAPANFGRFSKALLVGNFGDGRINAFDPKKGTFLGQLKYRDGGFIAIDGLWGLAVGPARGVAADALETLTISLPEGEEKAPVLYFTAGIADEQSGLFGFIRRALPTDFR